MRFDAEFLKTLEHLRFVSAKAFAGAGRGERRGRHRGRGLEFADYRPYAQGDDFRHIDWKVYQRLGRLLLRLYEEEQDLRVYLFLDTSASMVPHGKFEFAVRLAAALCYVGLAHLDRVTVVPFAEQIGRDVSTGNSRPTIGRVLESLAALQPDGRTDLWRAVTGFAERPRRPGLAVVISDFLDPAGCDRALRLLRARGHEVTALHVVAGADRADAEGVSEVAFVDAETGELRTIDMTPALSRAYAREWDVVDAAVADACARSQCEYLRADVDVPFERTVLHTLRTGRFLE